MHQIAYFYSSLPYMDQVNPMQLGTWAAVVGSALTIILQVINIRNVNYKEERARKWRIEDEERAAALALKLEKDKEELARQTRHSVRDANNNLTLRFVETTQLLEEIKKEAIERLAEMRRMHEATQVKIDENTEISKEAFKEANGVNEKLLGLGAAMALAPSPKEVVVVNEEPIRVSTNNQLNPHESSRSSSLNP